jgi:glycosyltransferase involved in cell wall biosynthesis
MSATKIVYNIVFVCPKSSVTSERRYFEGGLGGNESSLYLLCRRLSVLGHNITVFINCDDPTSIHGISWKNLNQWDPTINTDFLIAFRSAAPLLQQPNARFKFLYLGDRKTDDIDLLDDDICHSIIYLSAYQMNYYLERHLNLANFGGFIFGNILDEKLKHFQKTQKKVTTFLHNVIPYRGLRHVLKLWPTLFKEFDASLLITSGYELWGYNKQEAKEFLQKDIDPKLFCLPGIEYRGAQPKYAYFESISEASFQLYPTSYQEMFCTSILECQAVGVIPIVSPVGALKERVRNRNNGLIINSLPDSDLLARDIIRLLHSLKNDPSLFRRIESNCIKSAEKYYEGCMAEKFINFLKLHYVG